MKKGQIGMACFAIIALSTTAGAQSFNIDMNATTGAGAGAPAATFGAAANQMGNWQTIGSFGLNVPIGLMNLDGSASAATLTSNAAFASGSFFSSTTNGLAAAPVDVQRLLADILDLGGTTQPQRSFTFSGLQNGIYDVYTYAMAPDSAAFISRVNVNANAGAADPGVQLVGGAYTGNWAQGITHALHSNVQVTNGTLVVNLQANTSFASLAGFQLVLVPAPSALALLGLAGLIGPRRRRT